ncbi:hypothetical protein VMCG_01582 [Cytospora schulzeri]|uniref:Uncharacterized protein n=1 Tax=Cytospora schulzeri TaxID=448051 RepID=A0A423X595_9PEZI|nr:hypothetical protein VMCG_01582 [Valsa malicola]
MSGSSGMSLPQERPHAVTKPPSPTRARHQLQRSITEFTAPVRLGKHHHHHRHNHHTPHASHHHSSHASSRHKRYSVRDDRNMSVPQSAAPVLQLPRASLDVPRSEGVTPGNISPTPSPRASLFSIPPGNEIAGGLSVLAPGESREEAMRREKERAEARTAGLQKSFVDLTAFSTSTTSRLDETYYHVLEKLTSLRKTIVALKELASASASTSDGFVKESQSALSEAQAQLDAFGQFDEQEKRVHALQDRVQGGRERIEALSTRVDVVRHKVERWERADREWQERTRRRLKTIWGVVLGLALVLLLLYIGAMAYGADIEDVAGDLREEAMMAKSRLESGGEGLLAAAQGDERIMALDFNSVPGAAEVRNEALRALDEL